MLILGICGISWNLWIKENGPESTKHYDTPTKSKSVRNPWGGKSKKNERPVASKTNCPKGNFNMFGVDNTGFQFSPPQFRLSPVE